MSKVNLDAGAPLLLETKLHAPGRRRGLVERPRLTDRLGEATLPALTIVAAPAGFGKTTLLADWFTSTARENRPTAWLSLDANDNDPVVFWSYLIAAVQKIATTRPGSSPTSPATIVSSSTTSPRRYWNAKPMRSEASYSKPRSWTASPERCATP